MRQDNTGRRPTEQDRLVRIAEMHGQAVVRRMLATPTARVGLMQDRDLYQALIRQMSLEDKRRWTTAYDWVAKPLSLHVARFEAKADSLRIPPQFGDWTIIEQGRLPDGSQAFKLQRDTGNRTYRVGWFDQDIRREVDRAVVVIRWEERLIELRTSYHAAVKLAGELKQRMQLADIRMVNFTYDEYDQFLDRFDASYISATLNTQDEEIGALVVKSSPGQRINRRRELGLRLGADGATPEREISSTDMTSESGWYAVVVEGDSFFAQFHRGRGTFHTKALISEAHINAILQAVKSVKGY